MVRLLGVESGIWRLDLGHFASQDLDIVVVYREFEPLTVDIRGGGFASTHLGVKNWIESELHKSGHRTTGHKLFLSGVPMF